MKDIQTEILKKSCGENRLKPDEQKKFLETFEERVIAYSSLSEANSPAFHDQFENYLHNLADSYQPLYIKISPNVQSTYQIYYLKVAQELHCAASIVSEQCSASPFGIVIHTDHPVEIPDKEIHLADQKEEVPKEKKKHSFWGKLFH